jgi:hypothetical protein
MGFPALAVLRFVTPIFAALLIPARTFVKGFHISERKLDKFFCSDTVWLCCIIAQWTP